MLKHGNPRFFKELYTNGCICLQMRININTSNSISLLYLQNKSQIVFQFLHLLDNRLPTNKDKKDANSVSNPKAIKNHSACNCKK